MERGDAGRELVVMIRCSPLGSPRGAEALRMAVGQSIANQVTVALVDAGIWLAGPLEPEVVEGGEVGKHLAMLLRLRQRVWVEAESLRRYELKPWKLHPGVELASRQEIDRALLAADVVMVF